MTYRDQLDELIRGYREDWQDDASCRGLDPEIFFLDRGQSSRQAKRICSGCPVRIECLVYALQGNEQFGIWGGMTDQERRRIRRNQKDPSAEPVRFEDGS